MQVRWNRVALVLSLFLIVAGSIWLRNDAYAPRNAWYDVQDRVTDFLSSLRGRVCLYGALSLLSLWIISRVRRWFRT